MPADKTQRPGRKSCRPDKCSPSARDTLIVENTPIDYLDFASPVSGLGGKIGFDATNKLKGETTREWGRPITMSAEMKRRVDEMWESMGIDPR